MPDNRTSLPRTKCHQWYHHGGVVRAVRHCLMPVTTALALAVLHPRLAQRRLSVVSRGRTPALGSRRARGFFRYRLNAGSVVAAARSRGVRLSRVAIAVGLSAALLCMLCSIEDSHDGLLVEDLSWPEP